MLETHLGACEKMDQIHHYKTTQGSSLVSSADSPVKGHHAMFYSAKQHCMTTLLITSVKGISKQSPTLADSEIISFKKLVATVKYWW